MVRRFPTLARAVWTCGGDSVRRCTGSNTACQWQQKFGVFLLLTAISPIYASVPQGAAEVCCERRHHCLHVRLRHAGIVDHRADDKWVRRAGGNGGDGSGASRHVPPLEWEEQAVVVENLVVEPVAENRVPQLIV